MAPRKGRKRASPLQQFLDRSSAFNGDVYAWCLRHDSRAPEDWLYLVLDGTISLDEMRLAVVEDRTPRERVLTT